MLQYLHTDSACCRDEPGPLAERQAQVCALSLETLRRSLLAASFAAANQLITCLVLLHCARQLGTGPAHLCDCRRTLYSPASAALPLPTSPLEDQAPPTGAGVRPRHTMAAAAPRRVAARGRQHHGRRAGLRGGGCSPRPPVRRAASAKVYFGSCLDWMMTFRNTKHTDGTCQHPSTPSRSLLASCTGKMTLLCHEICYNGQCDVAKCAGRECPGACSLRQGTGYSSPLVPQMLWLSIIARCLLRCASVQG